MPSLFHSSALREKSVALNNIFPMRSLLLPFVALVVSSPLAAQSPIQVEWEKTFGSTGNDAAYAVAALADGSVVVVGQTQATGRYDTDVWVARIGKAGNKVWEKALGGTGSDVARAVAVLPNGDIAIGGSSAATPSSDSDGLLLILNADGAVVFEGRYGEREYESFAAITATLDGNIVLAGTKFEDNSSGMWVLKAQPDGKKLWDKYFLPKPIPKAKSRAENPVAPKGIHPNASRITLAQLGSTELSDVVYSEAYCLLQNAQGELLIAGYAPGKNAAADAWLVKTNANGEKMWERTFGDVSADEAYGLLPAEPGFFYAFGSSFDKPETSNQTAYLAKVSENKDIAWEKHFNDTTTKESNYGRLDYAKGGTYTNDGGILLVGISGYEPISFTTYFIPGADTMTNDHMIAIQEKLAALKHELVAPSEIKHQYYDYVEKTDGKGNIIRYREPDPGEKERRDGWILKVDAAGRKRWGISMGGAFEDECRAALRNADGSYTVVGFTRSKGAGQSDAWVIRFRDTK